MNAQLNRSPGDCHRISNKNKSIDSSTIGKNRICWDFTRGACHRKQCRYPHVSSTDLVVFCHDYQNSTCSRTNCKFLHYTLDEEEHYQKYGEFPPCADYANYFECRHRLCAIITSAAPAQHNNREKTPPSTNWIGHDGYGSVDCSAMPQQQYDSHQAIKRPIRDSLSMESNFKRLRDDAEDRIDISAVLRRFEEEQAMLRRRVESNEIKIAELRASNEYLMAQNAHLRLNSVQQQCSTVVNPVTVSQTTSQPQTSQVMGSVQVQATPIVSIATPPTQIIANSATPLTLAANTSQAQQLAIAQQNITSLSNAGQSLTPSQAQQILGASQITLAPAIAQGASMGLTINTSQALAISNATQPIISYPIMTHSIH